MNLFLQVRLYITATFLFGILPFSLWGQNGSVIVIQTKGVVEAISPAGVKLVEPVVRGSVLPVGYGIKTGLFAESTLLLSNGTTATVQENSILKLTKFDQAPFDAQGDSFGQLTAEPSTSQVSFDMEVGSLVVQTKKLNKASSLTISTPTGVAGIRGTQFQMAMSPVSGMKLDVAESQVAFTPVGQNQPIVVGAGKGLDASSSGTIKQRPINPSAAQNISTKNSAATSACSSVSVATAKQANSKAENKQSSSEAGERSESSSEESSDTEAQDSFIKQASNVIREVSGQEASPNNPDYLAKILTLTNQTPKFDDGAPSLDFSPPKASPPPPPSGVSPPQLIGDIELQFNPNSEVELVTSLMGFPFGPPIQLGSLSSDEINTEFSSWISTDYNFASIAVESFLEHATIANYSNDNINDSFREAWFITSLFFHDLTDAHEISGDYILQNVNWGYTLQGDIVPGAVLNAYDMVQMYEASPYLYDLGVQLIDRGALGDNVINNGIALNILDEFIGTSGSGLPSYFSIGSFSDGNSYLINSVLLGASHNDLLDALDSNEKRSELDKLFKIYNQNINAVLGSEIHIGSPNEATVVNVGEWLQKASIFESDSLSSDPTNNKKIFAFTAGKDLHLAGDVTFKNSVNGKTNRTEDHALVLGSAQNTVIGAFEVSGVPADRSTIHFEGSNLGIGSYDDLTLTHVDIDVGGNLALGTLSNLNISQTSMNVGRHSDRDNVYMYADEMISIDTLTFSDRARVIYMEANTVDLSNVSFPADSQVMLRSKLGEPHFYNRGGETSPRAFYVNFDGHTNTYAGSPITEAEFSVKKTHGEPGYDSQNFKTGAGEPAIKIRAFPDAK